MKQNIRVGPYEIGPGEPPFIIAEVGINHNGRLDLACEMIQTAKRAGASAVKFQTFKAEEFCGDETATYTYLSQGRTVTEPMREMFKRVELRREAWFKIKEECDRNDIIFMSTPQNVSDMRLLLEIGVPMLKIGSDDFTNIPLVKTYAQTGLPLVLSCGMSDLAEVHQTLEAAGAFEGHPTVLCLCTSQYPTPPADVNLRKLETLKHAFPMVHLGFSDHSQGPLASSLATAFGACVFEKHFTLSRDLPGPDHWFSENPETLKAWVDAIKTSTLLLGSALVRPTTEEREMKKIARRSIAALTDIACGTALTHENTGLRRPGTGLPPVLLEQLIGMRSTRDIKQGEHMQLGDFTK